MPKPGQKTITLKEEVYKQAEEKAEKLDRSVAGFVTDLILANCKRKEAKA